MMSGGGAARQMASLLPLIESKGSKDRETCSMPLQAGGSPHTFSLSSSVPQKRHLRAMQSTVAVSLTVSRISSHAQMHHVTTIPTLHATCDFCTFTLAPRAVRPRPCAHAHAPTLCLTVLASCSALLLPGRTTSNLVHRPVRDQSAAARLLMSARKRASHSALPPAPAPATKLFFQGGRSMATACTV